MDKAFIWRGIGVSAKGRMDHVRGVLSPAWDLKTAIGSFVVETSEDSLGPSVKAPGATAHAHQASVLVTHIGAVEPHLVYSLFPAVDFVEHSGRQVGYLRSEFVGALMGEFGVPSKLSWLRKRMDEAADRAIDSMRAPVSYPAYVECALVYFRSLWVHALRVQDLDGATRAEGTVSILEKHQEILGSVVY